MGESEFFDVHAAAARYKVSASTIRRWFANGYAEFPRPIKRNGKFGWELETLRAWETSFEGVLRFMEQP